MTQGKETYYMHKMLFLTHSGVATHWLEPADMIRRGNGAFPISMGLTGDVGVVGVVGVAGAGVW